MSNVNPADYRSDSSAGRATAAQAAQGRALQAEFAKSYGIWYRPGFAFSLRSSTGRGHKPKKPKHIAKHRRHNEALAAGATADPFHNRGVAKGF